MKIVKVFLPGNYEDAHIYMGKLITIDVDRNICFINFDEISDQLKTKFPNQSLAIKLLFERNDWLASEQFQSIINDETVAKEIKKRFDELPEDIEVSIKDIPESFFIDTNKVFDIPLDMHIYNKRIYLGTETGLYHLDFDLSKSIVVHANRLEKRLDLRCSYISAKANVLNASCGEDGLFSAIESSTTIGTNEHIPLIQYYEKSVRTEWMNLDLVNYSSNYESHLLRNEIEKKPIGGIYNSLKNEITKIGIQKIDLNYILHEIQNKYPLVMDDIQYVSNSNDTIFVFTQSGNFYSLIINSKVEGNPILKYVSKHKVEETNILSTNIFKLGVIIETFDGVWISVSGEWHRLLSKEVLSIRI